MCFCNVAIGCVQDAGNTWIRSGYQRIGRSKSLTNNHAEEVHRVPAPKIPATEAPSRAPVYGREAMGYNKLTIYELEDAQLVFESGSNYTADMSEARNREGDESDLGVVMYIVKADKTSYINYIKPLIMVEELQIPHTIEIVDTKAEWYGKVHPERYVPALKDRDEKDGGEIFVFESTACLQYLAERYDISGEWTGRTSWERAQVLSWTAYFTAGLGATAKYWLYFAMGYPNRQNPEILPKTIAKLRENCLVQWNRLNERLADPDQLYIALPDRPSIADISYFPFTLAWMFSALGADMADWPHIKEWSERLWNRPSFQCIMERGPRYGHENA